MKLNAAVRRLLVATIAKLSAPLDSAVERERCDAWFAVRALYTERQWHFISGRLATIVAEHAATRAARPRPVRRPELIVCRPAVRLPAVARALRFALFSRLDRAMVDAAMAGDDAATVRFGLDAYDAGRTWSVDVRVALRRAGDEAALQAQRAARHAEAA
jgi:hypothetical protein